MKISKEIKPGGVIRYARQELGMTQVEFGEWLAKEMKKSKPISFQLVSKWERGERTPRFNVREACRGVAAKRALRLVTNFISQDNRRDAMIAMIDSQS